MVVWHPSKEVFSVTDIDAANSWLTIVAVLPSSRAESFSSAASQNGLGRQQLLQGSFDSHASYSGIESTLGSGLYGEKDLYWIWSSVADWP